MAGEEVFISVVRQVFLFLGWPGVVFLVTLENAGVPFFPSELVLPLAGWMLIQEPGRGAFYILLGGALAALGDALGSFIPYGLGVLSRKQLLEKWKWGKRFVGESRQLKEAERWFRRSGPKAVLLCQPIPWARSLIGVPAGLAGMSPSLYMFYSFLGSLPTNLALVAGGYFLGDQGEKVGPVFSTYRPVLYPLLLALALFFLRRQLKPYLRPVGEAFFLALALGSLGLSALGSQSRGLEHLFLDRVFLALALLALGLEGLRMRFSSFPSSGSLARA